MATVVKAKKDENTDSLIRRFKKQVLIDEVLTDVKKRDFYIKPSQIRKEKKKEIQRLRRRAKRLGRTNF